MGIAGITTVPHVKMKNLTFTKKRYLERQRLDEKKHKEKLKI